MNKVGILIIVIASIFSCNISMKQDQINKWFYGLPVYDNGNEIVKQLLSDNRFIIEEVPDTTNYSYIYRARINKQYQSTGIYPDSSVIEFTYADYKTKNHTNIPIVKLLTVNYFFSNSKDIENLYETSYSDLKSIFNSSHDVSETLNDKPYAIGKEIIYLKSGNKSQKLQILKTEHINGTKSLELRLLFGDP